MAQCLYTTILTDTGGFCYGATRASTFALAEELIRAGADPVRIAQEVYFSTPMSKLLLLGAALDQSEARGKAGMALGLASDMVRTCAAEEDCEGIVNYAISICRRRGGGVSARTARRPHPHKPAQQGARGRGQPGRGTGRWRPRKRRRLSRWTALLPAPSKRFWASCVRLCLASRPAPISPVERSFDPRR